MVENPYRRQHRQRSGRREAQQDAVTAALTIQVIACVLILLLAVLVKKRDAASYGRIKQEYGALVTQQLDPEQVGQVIDKGQSAWQQAFEAMENLITNLLARFTGDPGRQLEPPAQPQEEIPEGTQESQPENQTADFRFDYLAPAGAVYRASIQPAGTASNLDVSTLGNPTPEGCTMLPVLLAAKIKPPVTGLITSDFAFREHPLSGNDDFHNGMDIAAEEGREVLAALPGEVVETGWSDIYGNYIILRHATNLQTFYAHCSEIIAEEGLAVRQGDRIAKVGQTGVATGPHLHFSVIVEDQYTDPYWVLQDNIKLVDQA